MSILWIRILFVVSGVYDGLLGAAFIIAPGRLFRDFGVTPPNHIGYVQFPALLLILFAVMFFRIALDPVGRREQIVYGMGLKLSYFGLVFWYLNHGGIPQLWVPFAWADLLFFLLFFWAWRSVSRQE